jgi:hypothetical protein
MDVSPLVWTLTVAGTLGRLMFDYVFHVHRAHVPSLREAAIWSSVYVGIALLFGVGTLVVGGPAMGFELGVLPVRAGAAIGGTDLLFALDSIPAISG